MGGSVCGGIMVVTRHESAILRHSRQPHTAVRHSMGRPLLLSRPPHFFLSL